MLGQTHAGVRTRRGTWTHREAAGAQDRETDVAGERGDGGGTPEDG